MKYFAKLYQDLDQTTRTAEKTRILLSFFQKTPEEEALWTLALLWGKVRGKKLPSRLIRETVAEVIQLPLWLIEESYGVVGDLAETVALLLPDPSRRSSRTLREWIEFIELMRSRDDFGKKEMLKQAWDELEGTERFLFNKLITGSFRVGTGRGIIGQALAEYTGQDQAVILHYLIGEWSPEMISLEELLKPEEKHARAFQPYPFHLASPFVVAPQGANVVEDLERQLGHFQDWIAEWKWDGIRGQLIRRYDSHALWSRGEEVLTDRFPEFLNVARGHRELVLDGEVVCLRDNEVLPFSLLQKRITRKTVTSTLLNEAPAAFLAYDLLEFEGRDIRNLPLEERRSLLEQVVHEEESDSPLRVSPLVSANSWEELCERQTMAREMRAEGIMIKRKTSPYRVGRKRGDWWKWKVDPLSVDAVLLYAQRGHGRRANLFTDFTFGVWDGSQLVTFAKAYSGLTDEEMKEVDTFVKNNTQEKFGPVRTVKPELVFEIAFEGIQLSKRHKSGVAVRFPRILRRRTDKRAEDADTLKTLHDLLNEYNK